MIRNIGFALLIWACTLINTPSSWAQATSSHDSMHSGKGYQIAYEADLRDQGFGDSLAAVKMILRNASGATSERTLTIKTLEKPDADEGDWSLILFQNPPDVGGTALLTYAKVTTSDQQWLYLPALKRVKRIASSNKSGPFMGSEFSFEDMAAPELEKYSYKYLREEACGDYQCDVLERVATYKNSGYSKTHIWIDRSEFRTWRIDYFNHRSEKAKTLTFHDYRLYDDQYWRAHDMRMANHLTGKSTQLLWSPYQFGNGFEKSDFSRASLKRQ